MNSINIKRGESYLNLDTHALVGLGRARFSDGAIVDANPTIARAFGFNDVNEFIRVFKISENYVDQTQRRQIQSTLKEKGEINNVEIKFYKRDGTTFWLMTCIRYIREEEINEFLAFDVTTYKQQQKEIKESREAAKKALEAQKTQINAVLQNIADGVLAVDNEYRLTLANPQALSYLSILKSNLSIGHKLTSLGDRPIAEFLAPPPADTLSHEITVEQPETRIFEVVAKPLKMADKNQGWTLILRDLTQKKTIQKHNEVQARLAAIGQLVAGISHDFNNILFGMMGYTQLLQRMPDMPEKAQSRLNKILTGGEQASDMIKQLMDFSRTSSSIQEPTSLAACVKASVSLMKRVLPGSIDLATEIDSTDFQIKANKSQLIQVLMNLAVNAQDAMPNGGTLLIKLCHQSQSRYSDKTLNNDLEGEWCTIEVTDTGKGIPDDVLPHILEPFFTTKSPSKGTGLGLSQAYGIIKQHQGYLIVDSKLGKGSSFFILLPILESPQHLVSKAPPFPANAAVDEKTILLVDDETTVLESGKEMLESLGFRAKTAHNGTEALEVLCQHHIDLIIVDLIMPVMGGEAMIETLREKNKPFKALILSGYSPIKNWQEKFGKEVKAWISKPLNIETLEKAIVKALLEN